MLEDWNIGMMERLGILGHWKNGIMECWNDGTIKYCEENLFILEGILPITHGLLSLERFNQFKQPIFNFVVQLV